MRRLFSGLFLLLCASGLCAGSVASNIASVAPSVTSWIAPGNTSGGTVPEVKPAIPGVTAAGTAKLQAFLGYFKTNDPAGKTGADLSREPGALILLGVGMILFGAFRRKRRV
jgi:hypothetical protein